MAWTWQLHAGTDNHIVAEGPSATQPAGGFPSQAEAETWVGEVWRDLLGDGIDAVTLLEEDRVVYGPMSLHASA